MSHKKQSIEGVRNIKYFKLECIDNSTLKGISYWQAKDSGTIFVYTAKEFSSELEVTTQESALF